jgi:hypothetical protein
VQQAPPSTQSNGVRSMKEAPIWDFIQAFVSGILLLLISSYSIQSTENLIQGGNGSGIRPDFAVFTQLYDLSQGQYWGIAAIALIIAWLLWFCYLGVAFKFERYKMHLESQKKGAGEAFISFIVILITIDSYANWNSLSRMPWPWYWQLTVTMGIALGLMYLGHFAVMHLLQGIKGLKGA